MESARPSDRPSLDRVRLSNVDCGYKVIQYPALCAMMVVGGAALDLTPRRTTIIFFLLL